MIQISFDKVIPSRNELDYCTKMKKVRIKEWWQYVTVAKLAGYNKKFEEIHIVFKIYFSTKRNRDVDNYMASLGIKGIIDGIVEAEFIPDDSMQYLNYSIDLLIDKENPRTEVLLYGAKEGNKYYK